MTISAFKRMTKSVLTFLGEDAFLRTTVPCRVNIEHSVQVTDEDGMVYERSVATIDSELDPKVGDALSHPDGNFTLDRRFGDNGYSIRFILLPAP